MSNGFSNDFSLDNLKKYVVKNYSFKEKKQFNYINSSLDSFWYKYINETYPSIEISIASINNCINDLNYGIRTRKGKLLAKIEKTDNRTNNYDLLNRKLLNKGIHSPDNNVILDAYDFNLNNVISLDFITFDKNLYKCSIELNNEFNFNKILGLVDFFFSLLNTFVCYFCLFFIYLRINMTFAYNAVLFNFDSFKI